MLDFQVPLVQMALQTEKYYFGFKRLNMHVVAGADADEQIIF